MKRIILAAMAGAVVITAATGAEACTPVVQIDTATAEALSPAAAMSREQAGWRARSNAVFLAQIRQARMISRNDVEFTLAPIVSVYDAPLPGASLTFVSQPGNTCNTVQRQVADVLVVYAENDGSGWRVVGLVAPENLQDRPQGFGARLREIARGLIGPDIEAPKQ